jgi:predicted esterase
MLVGFHGYKENADRMLEALRRIRGDRAWLLVSVQALNRFYARDNEVVASWMTRQDRDAAISDNIAYVISVVSAVRRDYASLDTLVYAGFSQGVAMAYRAAAFAVRLSSLSRDAKETKEEGPLTSIPENVPPARGLIVLAGDVPPDVAPLVGALPPVLIGRGSTDHWYTESKAAADLETFRKTGVEPAVHVFDGGHEWDSTFITRAGEFLDAATAATAQDHASDAHPKWNESR